MADLNCPDCAGNRLMRFGKTLAGLQKYRCRDCHRQLVAGSDHLIKPETRDVVLRLLSTGVHPTTIAKAMPGISLRWIYELRRRMKRNDR